MKKLMFAVSFSMAGFISFSQNISSPEKFLGYPLGAHFTPHFKIANYFKQVAENAPNMVKLEQYGETNEGRPLLLAFVATPENLQRLEAIRLNNLRLAGMAKDKMMPDEKTSVRAKALRKSIMPCPVAGASTITWAHGMPLSLVRP